MDNNTKGKDPNDGYFELVYLNDGVYLKVSPALPKGKPVLTNDILCKLKTKKVTDVDIKVVEKVVRESNRVSAKIAPQQEEKKADAQIVVSITDTKMKANIVIMPPDGGNLPTEDDIINELKNSGVKRGYKDEFIKSLAGTPFFNKSVCVAEGKLHRNGKNGTVEFLVNFNVKAKPTILEDGRVDYRQLNIVKSVSEGQEICVIVPPDDGEDGYDVTGKEIKAKKGKPSKIPRGKNVYLSDDGKTIISKISGKIEYIDGKVNVFPVFDVSEDIGTATGNIDFIGNVNINGNVLSGFTVTAEGNIEVEGVVEAATLIAGGDIIVKRGVQGGNKAFLKSGNDIIAKYLEYCKVEAVNDVKSEALMHCDTKVGNSLVLSGRRGLLVGGVCKVGKFIEVKTIGNHISTPTQVEVGTDPTVKEKYKELRSAIQEREQSLKKAEQAINILQKLEQAGHLDETKKEIYNKTKLTSQTLKDELETLEQDMEVIKLKMEQSVEGLIKVSEKIFNGTKITFGTTSTYIKDVQPFCSVYLDNADIKFGPY